MLIPQSSTGRRTHALATSMLHAERLVQLGARVPLLGELVDLPKVAVKRIFLDVTGQHSPRGPLPSSLDARLASHQLHLHASVFLLLFTRIAAVQPRADAAVLVDAFEAYLVVTRQRSDGARLSVAEAWQIVEVQRRDPAARKLVHCKARGCGLPYLFDSRGTRQAFDCPACYLRASLRKPRATKIAERSNSVVT